MKQIVSMVFSFPDRDINKVILTNIFELLNIIFYPFAIGLALPIILSSLALEKEEKIKDLMKINGMSLSKYYFANFIFWFIFLCILCLIFFVSGNLLLKDGFFHHNSYLEIVAFSIGWNVLQIVFAFFLLSFINSAGAASATGYIFSTIGVLFSINTITFIYPFPDHLPYGFNLIPQLNFVRLMYYFLVKGSSEIKDYEQNEFYVCLGFLYFNILFYSLLTYLCSDGYIITLIKKLFKKKKQVEVVPNVDTPPQQELTDESIKNILNSQKRSKLSKDSEFNKIDNDSLPSLIKEYSKDFAQIHTSAQSEFFKIIDLTESQNKNDLSEYSLCVQNLYKKYDSGKVALDDLNLLIEKGQIYGLLGPNGAGKTTMISIVTGFLSKTSGNIFINGKNTDDFPVKNKLALCPQFNIQWPNLTVWEHLTIFGMMRNLSGATLKNSVDKIIHDIDLEDKKNIEASKLSGGMRRRLSIGISLMGDTEIIFLDEPTTGLDPKRRRELWQIIKSIKKNKTFIISTHLMEEAEFLCDKIGIINFGVLRAVGTSNYLKSSLVDFFRVELTIKDHYSEWPTDKKTQIENILQGEIIYEFRNLIKIEIKKTNFENYSKILESIDSCSDFVKSWSLKSGSLEDAFTEIDGNYRD